MFKKAGIGQRRAQGDSRFVAMEPAPAQRKDSVLRRDMKGSVLTRYSVTHTRKLNNIVEPLNALRLAQRPLCPRSV